MTRKKTKLKHVGFPLSSFYISCSLNNNNKRKFLKGEDEDMFPPTELQWHIYTYLFGLPSHDSFFTLMIWLQGRWRVFYSLPPHAPNGHSICQKELGLDVLKMRRVLKFDIYIVYKNFIPCLVIRQTSFTKRLYASDFLCSR